MAKSRAILLSPFLISLLAFGFCLWTGLGNDVNICITTGCTLYQDFSVFGLSLWWYGAGAFALLALCAITGFSALGRGLAALFLFGDIVLLALMMITAPCVNCLLIAVFFGLSYIYFRKTDLLLLRSGDGEKSPRSILLLCWLFLFVINLGSVVRSQMEIWPILDENGEGRGRLFFSPSCRFCGEGINYFSGKVYMAFYPVADNDSDIYRIARMMELLDQGSNIAEALAQSADFSIPDFFSSIKPKILILRLRLLINKAHVLSAGSQGVPFIEYLGLPPEIKKQIRDDLIPKGDAGYEKQSSSSKGPGDFRDPSLPVEIGGQCGGLTPCPPAN